MKGYTLEEFTRILHKNGWREQKRGSGNHIKFKKKGKWESIVLAANRDPERVITNRLIKQHNLKEV